MAHFPFSIDVEALAMPVFVVCSRDIGLVNDDSACRVEAETAGQALDLYRERVLMHEPGFREWVLSTSVNESFIERFFVQEPQEREHFQRTGEALVSDETVRERIRQYFGAHTSFAEAFLAYLRDEDPRHITTDMFRFLVQAYESGTVAVDLDSIAWLPANASA